MLVSSKFIVLASMTYVIGLDYHESNAINEKKFIAFLMGKWYESHNYKDLLFQDVNFVCVVETFNASNWETENNYMSLFSSILATHIPLNTLIIFPYIGIFLFHSHPYTLFINSKEKCTPRPCSMVFKFWLITPLEFTLLVFILWSPNPS